MVESWLVFLAFEWLTFSSVQFISVAQSCPTLCDPMNCSTPGGCDGAQVWPRGATPHPRSGQKPGEPHARGAVAKRTDVSEVRGGGREELPHVQGAVAAWAQEGIEEPSHVEGQEGWQ